MTGLFKRSSASGQEGEDAGNAWGMRAASRVGSGGDDADRGGADTRRGR